MVPHSIEILLRYPLYKLYYLEDISSFKGLSATECASFLQEYEDSLRLEIITALKWASEHPNVDLTNILPNLPFPNNEIQLYLKRVLTSLQNSNKPPQIDNLPREQSSKVQSPKIS